MLVRVLVRALALPSALSAASLRAHASGELSCAVTFPSGRVMQPAEMQFTHTPQSSHHAFESTVGPRLSHVSGSSVYASGLTSNIRLPLYIAPVEPYPPSPRELSGKLSSSLKTAWTNGRNTSWAILSPGYIVYALVPRFSILHFISPR